MDIDTDSNNNGTIDPSNDPETGTDDPIERNAPGRLVQVLGTRARVDLKVDLAGESSSEFYAMLNKTGGTGNITIWDAETGGSRILLSEELTLSCSGVTPGMVWVEGAAEGTFDLTLLVRRKGTSETFEDAVRFTVIDVNLDTDSNNDGRIVHATDDPMEMDAPGRLVQVPGDRARVDLKVDLAGMSSSQFYAMLNRTGGTGTITIWDAETGGNEIPLSQELTLGSSSVTPSTVWVEGATLRR